MFKKLRFRLTTVCTIVTSIILVAMAVSSFIISKQYLQNQANEVFASDLNAIFYHLNSQNILDFTWLSQTESSSGMILYLEDLNRPLLIRGGAEQDSRRRLSEQLIQYATDHLGYVAEKMPQSRLQPQTLLFSYDDPVLGECDVALAKVPVPGDKWVDLTAVKPLAPEKAQISALGWTFAGFVAVAILLLWLFAWLFTKRAIRPIEESRRKQVEFVSAASHELRSPLAVIQASISAVPEASPEQARRFAQTISQECRRMSRLVDDMLMLAAADNSTWSVLLAETDLETLLLDVSEWFESDALKKGLHLSVSLPDQTLPKCWCDQQRIRQVLLILLDNAISYTPSGGTIRLSAEQQHANILIHVEDNGIGIPHEQKEHIFDRFYRVDASRTRKEHFGLGLSIAKEIVSLHHGRITVEDTPGGGTTFTLILPLGT